MAHPRSIDEPAGRDSPPSVSEKLKLLYGEGIDPEVSLNDDPTPASGPSSELLSRLAERGLHSTRYRLEGEVARGGMGAILKVWDADLRRHLAMKVILQSKDLTTDADASATDPRMLSRFLEEAQVTGQLDHPGIVPVHELGLAEDGRIYFTMRLVKGRDLRHVFERVFAGDAEWSETRALNVMLRVCEALSFAHARGVVHRDLKPGNVMVGSFGEVYVMDWGLARVVGRKDHHDLRLAPEAPGRTTSIRTERRDEREDLESPIVTMDGDVVGTPVYMSPEQARGEIEELGPRSDVYAVGAMLYHLLARRMPYAPATGRISARTILACVIQGPPERLAKIRADVPAELVAIVEKAMARDGARRYATTLELAEDLRAYLEHRVVRAYETGAWAEARKWVERNKHLAAALAAVVLLLVAGLTASLIFKARADERAAELLAASTTILQRSEELAAATKAARESEQRALRGESLAKSEQERAETNARIAETRREEAEAAEVRAQAEKDAAQKSAEETKLVAEFQLRMLSDLSIDEFGHTILVELRREVVESAEKLGIGGPELDQAQLELDRALSHANATNVAQRVLAKAVFEPAVRTIENEYGDKPLLGALLQTPLSDTLRELSLYDLGLRTASPALTARRAALGDEHPDTLASIDSLGLLLYAQGKHSEAEPLFREALAGRRAQLGDGHLDTLSSITNLAHLFEVQGETSEPEPLLREVLAGRRAQLGDEHPDTLASIDSLGLLLYAQGKHSEAESLCREALAGRRAKYGDEHPATLSSINNLAGILQAQGKLAEAEPLYREALEGNRAKLGDDHPQTLITLGNLATVLHNRGQLAEAEPLYRQAVEGNRAKLGDQHPNTLSSINSLAALLKDQGKLAEVEPLCREALAGNRAKLGDEHPNTLVSINNLASLLLAQGKLAEAEPLFREALAGCRAKLGDGHPYTLAAINYLALLLKTQGRLAEAEPLYREALAGRRAKLGDEHPETFASINNLARLLQAQGKLTEAEPLCREVLAGCRTTLGDEHPFTLNSLGSLASLLRAQGKLSEAEASFREVLAGRRAKLGDQHPDTLTTIDNLAVVLQEQGELAEAEPLFGEAFERRQTALGDSHADSQKALGRLVRFYDEWQSKAPTDERAARVSELRKLLQE